MSNFLPIYFVPAPTKYRQIWQEILDNEPIILTFKENEDYLYPDIPFQLLFSYFCDANSKAYCLL